MIYSGLLLSAVGFSFICGFYINKSLSLRRLKKFIGKPITFKDVIEIIGAE